MKRDWLLLFGTLALAAWVWHSERKFFCYYTASYQSFLLPAAQQQKISWMERVLFAAALSSASTPLEKTKCPRDPRPLGQSVGI